MDYCRDETPKACDRLAKAMDAVRAYLTGKTQAAETMVVAEEVWIHAAQRAEECLRAGNEPMAQRLRLIKARWRLLGGLLKIEVEELEKLQAEEDDVAVH